MEKEKLINNIKTMVRRKSEEKLVILKNKVRYSKSNKKLNKKHLQNKK